MTSSIFVIHLADEVFVFSAGDAESIGEFVIVAVNAHVRIASTAEAADFD